MYITICNKLIILTCEIFLRHLAAKLLAKLLEAKLLEEKMIQDHGKADGIGRVNKAPNTFDAPLILNRSNKLPQQLLFLLIANLLYQFTVCYQPKFDTNHFSDMYKPFSDPI